MTDVDKAPGDLRRASWRSKFANAGRGINRCVRTQTSFAVHLLMAAAVAILASVLRCSLAEWCVLVLCVTGVLTAETFNTALERMAKAVTSDHDAHIADALDIASAAVLLGSLGSAAVGLAIFGRRLGVLFGWWVE